MDWNWKPALRSRLRRPSVKKGRSGGCKLGFRLGLHSLVGNGQLRRIARPVAAAETQSFRLARGVEATADRLAVAAEAVGEGDASFVLAGDFQFGLVDERL